MDCPRILFLTSAVEDYLADGLFHGLRTLYGAHVVDFPKNEVMYKTCPPDVFARVRGHGFTLYGLLDDIEVDRYHINHRLRFGQFDIAIFSDIWRQFGYFVELLPYLRSVNVAIIDGADCPEPFPYSVTFWRHRTWWTLPRAHTRFPYFKRELMPATTRARWFNLIPERIAKSLPVPENMRPIAFSIPEEKIVSGPTPKTKRFGAHVVDPEVIQALGAGRTNYAFSREQDYYGDLQASRFGITTKRAGWDCLRHYEIAANACVPAFRDLDKKATTCAPHGLDDGNCVVYDSAESLLRTIDTMTDERYASLQRGALAWAHANSTVARARKFLDDIRFEGR